MADYQMLGELLGLPNVSVLGYQIIGNERIEVQIRSSLEAALCPECQQLSTQIHDTAEAQTLWDLPIWDRQCWLRYAFGGRGALLVRTAAGRFSHGGMLRGRFWSVI
jgi:hypothetical protein